MVAPLPPKSLAPLSQNAEGRRAARSRMTMASPAWQQRLGRELARLGRRRWLVRVAKYLLPLAALALLGTVAAWPEISRQMEQQTRTLHRLTSISDANGAQVVRARYRGVDERNRPYTVTASLAIQVAPERVNLTDPKGDLLQDGGGWVMLVAKRGVYTTPAGILDLADDVTVYRDDGTVLRTDAATMDLKAGNVLGGGPVHAEGPFGQLDAQGFALMDKGNVVQFTGPAQLVLNAAGS